MEVEMKPFRQGGSLPSGLAWNAKDQVWLCGDEFGTVLRYDEDKDAFERHNACDSTINVISINKNGNICALGFNDSLNLREYPEVSSVLKDTLLRKELPLTCIEFDSTGSLVFVASMQEDVNIHSMEGSTSSQTRINTNGKAIRTFSLSPSNKFIGVVDVEGAVKIFSLKIVNNSVESVDMCCEKFDIVSKRVSEFGGLGIDFGCKLSWYPDESRRVLLAAPSVEGSIVFLSLDTSSGSAGWSETFLTCDSVSQPSLVFTKGVPLNLVAFSPSGDHLAACDTAGCVVVWSTNATSPADSVPLRKISTAGALPLVDLVWSQKSSSSSDSYLLLLGKDTYHRVEGVVSGVPGDSDSGDTTIDTFSLGFTLPASVQVNHHRIRGFTEDSGVSSLSVLTDQYEYHISSTSTATGSSGSSSISTGGSLQLQESFPVATAVFHTEDIHDNCIHLVSSAPVLWSEPDFCQQVEHHRSVCSQWVVDRWVDSFAVLVDHRNKQLTVVVQKNDILAMRDCKGAIATAMIGSGCRAHCILYMVSAVDYRIENFPFLMADITATPAAATAATAATADVSRSVAAQLRRYSEAIHTQEVLDWLEECPNIRGVFPVVSADNPTQATLLVLVKYGGFRDVTPAAEKLYDLLLEMGFDEREVVPKQCTRTHGTEGAPFSANCGVCSLKGHQMTVAATVSMLVPHNEQVFGVTCGHGMEVGAAVYHPSLGDMSAYMAKKAVSGVNPLGAVLHSKECEPFTVIDGVEEVVVGVDVSLFSLVDSTVTINCERCCAGNHELERMTSLSECAGVGPVDYNQTSTWSTFLTTLRNILVKPDTAVCWRQGAASDFKPVQAVSDLGLATAERAQVEQPNDAPLFSMVSTASSPRDKYMTHQCLFFAREGREFCKGDSGSMIYCDMEEGRPVPLALFHSGNKTSNATIGIATPFPAVWQQVRKWLEEDSA